MRMTPHRILCVSVLMLALDAGVPLAQSPDAPAFDVVSVRPNVSGDEKTASYVQPGGRYTAENMTLRMLMKTAYGVHDDQIAGGPGWIETERFDIVARAEGYAAAATFRDQARVMLRKVLADRFRLTLVPERREIPVYGLVFARSDGRLGPQLVRADMARCQGPSTSVPAAPGAPEPSQPMPCDSLFFQPGHVGSRAVEFSTLVTYLSRFTDRLVVDRTGLAGKFDADLQWSPEALTVTSTSASGISLATALQEQLGLKLDSQRAVVDVLVITRVERPAAD
jgi:uncharacterized protein (TIGR03435 family)